MRKIIKSKHAQQEIVGFVIIIVIVAVIGVIFLGISLRKSRTQDMSTDDAEIANFLSTSAKYTSDCVLKEPFYAELQDLIAGCYSGKMCSDNRNSCDVLELVYKEMTESVWPAGADRPIKYTKLMIYYQANSEDPSTKNFIIEAIEQGNSEQCSARRSGKHSQYKYPGNLVVDLEICSA